MPTKFDFISPGVQLREIDESQVPTVPENPGILLIGRARSGPAMKPVRINKMSDFTSIFGDPMNGTPQNDPWRDGNTRAPNYAAYAAQAYLAADVGPVKFIRLLGKQKNSSNKAGWSMGGDITPPSASVVENGGACGLFLLPSASGGGNAAETVDGVLAAIFYVSASAIVLKGTTAGYPFSGANFGRTDTTVTSVVSASTLIRSNDANFGFKIGIEDADGTIFHDIDFSQNGGKYIRDVLNTDPTTFFNSANYGKTDKKYFLGETFDANVANLTVSSSAAGGIYGFIAGLETVAGVGFDDFEQELRAAKSGWFLNAEVAGRNYLFRLIALDEGTEFEKNFYTRISEITPATANIPEATFTLEIVRRHPSGDMKLDIVEETYAGISMDVNSVNYIGRRIGTQYQTWNTTKNKWDIYGDYANISNYVRVEVAEGVNKSDIPMGFIGPAAPETQSVTGSGGGTPTANNWIVGSGSICRGNNFAGQTDQYIAAWPSFLTASVKFPTFQLSTSGMYGTQAKDFPASAWFGLRHVRKGTTEWNYGFQDIALKRVAVDPDLGEGADISGASFFFSLDRVSGSGAGTGAASTVYVYESGSYDDSTSISALYGLTGSANSLIDGKGIKQYMAPFFGGADGVDVRRANPFSNERIGNSTDGYPNYTVGLALDMIEDKDMLQYELAAMPGIIDASRIDDLISITATRGDALAVIDMAGIWQPIWDVAGSSEQAASMTTLLNTLTTRQINNSYACTYYPNIRINSNNAIFTAPPSLAGIGAIARSEDLSHPWFAPAGFNRGGLSNLGGAAGPALASPGAIEHLTKRDRDQLYAAKVNPIARFPATGDTVIFGQRTMQRDASALDRINVRRLMIYLKRQIGAIADTILFDQNVNATWNRFKAAADVVLSDVQSNLGIVEYKLVLDDSTTTPDLVDRNIMYAKIFVKPARAIEFIAIDFVITRSGVEF